MSLRTKGRNARSDDEAWYVLEGALSIQRDDDRASARIIDLMNARTGTSEGDELDALAAPVDAYEAKHHAVDAPRKRRSDRLAVVHETAVDLHKAGLIDAQSLREFDKLL